MIVAVVGSVVDDVSQVADLLSETTEMKTVDSIQMFRELPERCDKVVGIRVVNHMPISDNHKRLFLKSLENEFGSVLISGNIILDENTLSWILSNGGKVVVVSREKLKDYPDEILEKTEKYYVDKPMQVFELEVRWKNLFERLHEQFQEQIILIDLSKDESVEQMEGLSEELEGLSTDSESDEFDVIKTISDKWMEDVNMGLSLEDSIRKAMEDLGMEVEEGTQPQQTVKKEEKPKPKPQKKVAKKEAPAPVPKKEEKPQVVEEDEDEQPNAVFCKISDGNMALLIPEGMVLEKRTIGDMKFNVATIEIPDFTSTKLQELTMMNQIPSQEKSKEVTKSKPIMSPSEKEPSKPQKQQNKPAAAPKQAPTKVVVEGNINELVAEKARLDKEIKQAREARDLELVEQLRKQRRAVRKKINAMKE